MMSTRTFRPAMRASLAALILLVASTAALADTLLMPKRDGTRGQPLVVWGVTTQPNGVAFTLEYGDGLQTTGNVTDRSYIAFQHTYANAGTYTVRLTIGAEQTTVDVRIFDPATLPGGVAGEAARGLKINMAIEDGLRYLWTSQSSRAANFPSVSTTFWNQGAANPQQWTALVALAFENHGYRLANNGSAPTGVYERFIVRRALNYVVGNLTTQVIASQPSGFAGQPVRDPCVGLASDVCTGLVPTSGNRGYGTGIAMLPLAGSGALDRVITEVGGYPLNRTYREILQRLSNALAWGQTDQNVAGRGGFGYNLNNGNWDGSTVGWALLGLMDAEAAGIVVPSWVKTELAFGLTGALNDNGSMDYQANGSATVHANANLEKAGIGLQGMFFIGEIGSARANLTKTYISDRWNSGRLGTDYTGWGCGAIPNRGCGYAMFNNFKGLKLQNIQTLPGVARPAGPGAIPAGDWYADYQDWLVANQTNPTTTGGGNWGGMLFGPIVTSIDAAAALAELILSPVALVLPDPDKFATVGLQPQLATAVELNSHTVTAHAESTTGTPVAGANVNFIILSGPNAGLTFSGTTDASGNVSWTYTDAGPIGSVGTDRIQASIGVISSNIAEMVWTLKNRPPVANDDTFSTPEDTVLSGNVITAGTPDTDPDGDVLTATVQTGVASGSLLFNANGAFTYTPVADFCGNVSFTYTLSDGTLVSNLAVVSIAVTCVNDAPVAGDDSNSTNEDTPVGGSVGGNDSDVDNPSLTWSLVTGPSHGAVAFNGDGSYNYTPSADYCGDDSFTYQVSDGSLADTATVNITVACVNDAPSAGDDNASTDEDTPLNASVAGNDADVDSASLTWSQVSGPSNGSLSLNGDGSYTYTPNPNFCGSDAFTYQVSDGTLADTAAVAITVNCVNDGPVAGDDSNSTNEDTPVSGSVAANDSDVESASLTFSLASGPSSGSVSFNGDGSYTYTPNANFCGSDAFTYQASDGSLVDAATVSITVNCANDPPVANDSAQTTAEDTPLAGAVSSSDIDGGAPSYALATGPAHGTIVFNPDGTYTYSPAPDYNGPDSFTFTVSDGAGGSDSGEVSINVTAVNDAPFCAAAGPSVGLIWPPEHQLVNVNVLGVTDPVEGSAITISIDSIWQDEPTNTVGDGNTPIDGYGVGTSTAQVRAERSGNKKVPGDGRMYYINFTGTDAEGGTCTGTVKVGVPHDQGNGNTVLEGGPIYKSTGS